MSFSTLDFMDNLKQTGYGTGIAKHNIQR